MLLPPAGKHEQRSIRSLQAKLWDEVQPLAPTGDAALRQVGTHTRSEPPSRDWMLRAGGNGAKERQELGKSPLLLYELRPKWSCVMPSLISSTFTLFSGTSNTKLNTTFHFSHKPQTLHEFPCSFGWCCFGPDNPSRAGLSWPRKEVVRAWEPVRWNTKSCS